jgi:ParB-like chromosome segregation protein Spo0J
MSRPPAPQIVRLKVSDLTPDPDNARVHGRDNLRAIRESLQRFGQVRPLLATSDHVVVAGNGTLTVAEALGWEELDVIVLPWEDREKARAYAIADNRTAELAAWDNDALAGQLTDLAASGLDMGLLGFDVPPLGDPSGEPVTQADRDAAEAEAEISYRCPACGFRWRYGDGGEVVAL